jgi:hypothetical protein
MLERRGEINSNPDENVVLRCVAAGLIQNLLEHVSRHEYSGIVRNELRSVYIHPGSTVFGGGLDPRFIVCSEVVHTSKTFARAVSTVDPSWLPELAPEQFAFGQQRLVSYLPGEDTVLTEKPIIKKKFAMFSSDIQIGVTQARIPIPEARRLQAEVIANATRQGWIKLTFNREPGRGRFGITLERTIARSGGRIYSRALFSDMEIQPGCTFYCTVREGFDGEWAATPQFRVLDLPEPSVVESKEGKVKPPEVNDIEELKKMWGAH